MPHGRQTIPCVDSWLHHLIVTSACGLLLDLLDYFIVLKTCMKTSLQEATLRPILVAIEWSPIQQLSYIVFKFSKISIMYINDLLIQYTCHSCMQWLLHNFLHCFTRVFHLFIACLVLFCVVHGCVAWQQALLLWFPSILLSSWRPNSLCLMLCL